MTPDTPPQWLERSLLLLLKARDRETVSGDLLEEYREEKLPRLGFLRANYWYARQLVSFASIQIAGGPLVKQLLTSVCLFTAAAGIWLCVMENILKHTGYGMRSAVAIGIAIQGLVTVLFLVFKLRPAFRSVVMIGAAAVAILGGWSIFRIIRGQHFEGFVLIIGTALVIQGGLTVATMLRTRVRMLPG